MTAPFPVYRFRDGDWDQPFALPRRRQLSAGWRRFRPGRPVLPAGAQISAALPALPAASARFDAGDDGVRAGRDRCWKRRPGRMTIWKGLSVWRDADGQHPADHDRRTTISRFFLRTEIVEYRVAGLTAPRGRGLKRRRPRMRGQVSATLSKRKTDHEQLLLPGILAMAAIVVASNILVQHLFGQWLTWGAFTYPLRLSGDRPDQPLSRRGGRAPGRAGGLCRRALSVR